MEDTLIRRTMPNSIEAEQSVVGSMLMDQDAVITASEILTKEDFYYRQYGILFDAMVSLFKENEPIDLVTIQARLRQMDMPEELVALEYIKELLETVPYSTNIATYAKMVKEKALLRELIHASETIASDCYEGKLSMGEVFEKTEKEIFDLVQSRNAGGEFTPISTIVLNALNKIQKASLTSGAVTGIATGFTDLDMMLSGLQPSDFILVAARPSMGKTAFVLNIAEYVAIRNKIPTVIFSLEMSKESLVNRLLSLESRVDAQNIRSGKLSDMEWGSLLEGADAVGESALTIDDTPGISVNDLRSKCRKLKMENKLSLIIIDYIGLMSSSSGRKSDSRQQEISDISRALKGIAREMNVPVIALSQLSRAVESRPDHRPMLSDLRDSGAIEQDADVVMFIYREDYYPDADPERKNIAEIKIAKQRNGPVGTVELRWFPENTRFGNLDKRI